LLSESILMWMALGVLVFTVVRDIQVTSAILRGQGTKGIDALCGAHAYLVPRWAAAGAIEPYLAHGAIASDSKRDIGARAFGCVGIGKRAVAVCIHFAVDVVYIPAEKAAKVSIRNCRWTGGCTLRHGTRQLRAGLLAVLGGVLRNIRLVLRSLLDFLLLRFLHLALNRNRGFVFGLLGFGLRRSGSFAGFFGGEDVLVGRVVRGQRDGTGDVDLDGPARTCPAP